MGISIINIYTPVSSGNGVNLTGNGDGLIVTSAGSIVADDGGDDVYATGPNESITLDGLVYSVNTLASGGVTGDGVYMTGAGDTLTVDSLVQAGGSAVQIGGGSGDFVDVGSQGSLQGVGLASFGFGIQGQDTSTSDSLDNAGAISATTAVGIANAGGDSIDNSGDISGIFGVDYYDNVASESIENSGTIAGGGSSNSYAIGSNESSQGIDVVNSGLITDSATSKVLYFYDDSGAESTIDNQGTISGSGNVLQSQSDVLYVNNSGTIHGDMYTVAAAYIDNSGLWQDSAGTGHISLFLADGSLTNAHAGTIDGSVIFNDAGDTVDNAGKIDGAVTLVSGGDTFTNAGDIDGAVTFTGTGVTNTFTNSGAITGNFTFSAEKSTLTNSGDITGNVTVAEEDTLTNHGEIYGNVTVNELSTFTNTGVVHGNAALGKSVTIDDSLGEVTGAITASALGADTFDYEGNFGNETIDRFFAGTGSTHDTIQFGASDFGSFAAVQAAMTQVTTATGFDTVIRLDATDSITLVGVTKASLVSADFKFV
jgi:hypothetical protein